MIMIFNNEIMTCRKCGTTQKAHPNIESGWYLVSIDNKKLSRYCPQCFDGGTEATKCSVCNNWFNWHYKQCPFCNHK